GPAGEDGGVPLGDDGLVLVVDRLDDPAQVQQAVEPRRRGGFDLAGQLAEQRQDAAERVAVDADRRRLGAGDGERRADRAAAKAAAERGVISSASTPGGRRRRRSRLRRLPLFSSQTQEMPAASPASRAKPVMLETPMPRRPNASAGAP